MEQLMTKKLAGIDISQYAVQFSMFDRTAKEMTEVYLPIETEGESEIARGLGVLSDYMKENNITWQEFDQVGFSLEDTAKEKREELSRILGKNFMKNHKVQCITRLHAFVEYVFHQEKVVWDRNTMLFDYSNDRLCCTIVEQITKARQKAYRAMNLEIPLEEYEIVPGVEEKDAKFCKMMKKFLGKYPTQVIYLTGKGFEGGWMKKTLNLLCSGRRVFLGQNIYANGTCYMGESVILPLEEGLILMKGEDMVSHTIGVVTRSPGGSTHTPITTIGKEWYNTSGCMDILLDKSRKVEFFYHNARENMMELRSCEIKDLPVRPEKTTRIRVRVRFFSATEGVILLQDLGFGSMYPGTGKVTVFPFSFIS